jgi:hypothetical protein
MDFIALAAVVVVVLVLGLIAWSGDRISSM